MNWKPQEISDVFMAFPADVSDLMPSYEECVKELNALPHEEQEKWRKFQRTWFFNGLSQNVTVDLKDGIDGNMAFRHLQAIQGSFQPKHQHKEAAVAYLASLWFNDVSNLD